MRENFTNLLEKITMAQMENFYPLINPFLVDAFPVIIENINMFGAPLTLNIEEVYNKHRESFLSVSFLITPTEERKESLIKKALTEFLNVIAERFSLSISAPNFPVLLIEEKRETE